MQRGFLSPFILLSALLSLTACSLGGVTDEVAGKAGNIDSLSAFPSSSYNPEDDGFSRFYSFERLKRADCSSFGAYSYGIEGFRQPQSDGAVRVLLRFSILIAPGAALSLSEDGYGDYGLSWFAIQSYMPDAMDPSNGYRTPGVTRLDCWPNSVQKTYCVTSPNGESFCYTLDPVFSSQMSGGNEGNGFSWNIEFLHSPEKASFAFDCYALYELDPSLAVGFNPFSFRLEVKTDACFASEKGDNARFGETFVLDYNLGYMPETLQILP